MDLVTADQCGDRGQRPGRQRRSPRPLSPKAFAPGTIVNEGLIAAMGVVGERLIVLRELQTEGGHPGRLNVVREAGYREGRAVGLVDVGELKRMSRK